MTVIASKGAGPFIAPAAILSLLVALVPLIFIFYNSTAGGTSAEAFASIVESNLFLRAMRTTMEVSLLASLISVVLGYVVALHLARQSARRRAALMVLVLLPFWTSILVKSYAFTIILGREGIINGFLSWATGIDVALPLIFNRVGVMVGMTNYLTPLVVFPVLASLLAIDPALYRAAEIMGAKPARIFLTVTLPLSVPGVLAGALSAAVMSLGFFIVPALMGGKQDLMLANLVDFYTREVLDWNIASAVGVILFALVAIFAVPATLLRSKQQGGH
ncbi:MULTISPECIES: ABC transporter permease [Rhizobium]|uniref:Putative spermidine/putrescine transport system permease protein/mannopine transport system permease protein n=1 Tax=Rhizobium metallidurans TaxID=1265931 RepID=A0A7W6GCJ0_9HYPH|nr:ABC transporter permease [Rhizobium sp. AN80A]MBB3966162.1 putative spermidine/putrescine transport system permease protein/mannopine transport system permease protein [Rhizobium metallidurans]